jgi:hypothetical protein
MNFEDEIVAEVRRHRTELFEQYGTVEAYHKHLEEERPRLEREGWKFADIDEMLRKKHAEESNMPSTKFAM